MNGKQHLTTVVIPNYNGMEYIEACLDSVLHSTVPVSVIVVDNASADGSRELVLEKFSDVRLIALPENTGFSYAVNRGIEAADTPYVFLLNNDTRVEPDCIFHLQALMENFPGAFSAAAKMINMKIPEKLDNAGDFYCILGWAYARGKDKPAEKYTKRDILFSSCAGGAIYRKEVFRETGLFDEEHFAYLEDVDIGYRGNIRGYRNMFCPEARLYHAGSAVSGSRHNPFKVRLTARNSIYLIYKNMPLLQLLLNLPFLCAGLAVKFLYFALKGMGRDYARGLGEGFALVFSEKGRAHKVKFRFRDLGNYCRIELLLLLNTIRRFL